MTRNAIVLCLVLITTACSGVHVPPIGADAGTTGDASLDPRYVDCPAVEDAYETARARLGCEFDWPNCPRTITNDECVVAFGQTQDCAQLDSVASRCSL